jgi:hypothetical protein
MYSRGVFSEKGVEVEMHNRLTGNAAAVAVLSIFCVFARPVNSQTPAYRAPRTADGKPDLNGIWQAMNTANWDIQGHTAAAGPIPALGAAFFIPAGTGIVEGEDIPYTPAAAAKKKENAANWMKLDPELKCYMPGIPRATYTPYPFQIVQSKNNILITYQFAGAVRVINMGTPTKAPADSWMGWSNGHWEGETLVVDVTNQTEDSWFDRAGNFHSDALHVVERYTPRSPETMMYEATIEDPDVFTRPWKISMPLYRHVEKNAQVVESKCVEFSEELLYGTFRKQATK